LRCLLRFARRSRIGVGTFKGQLDLEQHGGPTRASVITRVWQRVLALAAAIWDNDRTGRPVLRSLIAHHR
jgi:hypothetical protein